VHPSYPFCEPMSAAPFWAVTQAITARGIGDVTLVLLQKEKREMWMRKWKKKKINKHLHYVHGPTWWNAYDSS
jgi:hypothetical protein